MTVTVSAHRSTILDEHELGEQYDYSICGYATYTWVKWSASERSCYGSVDLVLRLMKPVIALEGHGGSVDPYSSTRRVGTLSASNDTGDGTVGVDCDVTDGPTNSADNWSDMKDSRGRSGVDFNAVAGIVESPNTVGDGVTSTGGGEASISGVLCAGTVGGAPTDVGAVDDGVGTNVGGNAEAPSVGSGVDDIAVGVYVEASVDVVSGMDLEVAASSLAVSELMVALLVASLLAVLVWLGDECVLMVCWSC